MDPISAAGITLSVAGLAGQVFTGCIQSIQWILTAKNLPKDCQYLNLRLRLEQQRLFAWSETSGLLDYDSKDNTKVLESNAFGLHRSTVLELLVQIKVLFEDFEGYQTRYRRLDTTTETRQDPSPTVHKPGDADSLDSLVPLPPKRKAFIEKALKAWKTTTQEGPKRLRWATFDKEAFETLLQRFSALNDSITDLLDMRLRDEIYSVTQDTNRGVLQLTHELADLQQLVKATLVLTLQSQSSPLPPPYEPAVDVRNNVTGMKLLGQLARFKAFNEFIELESPSNPSESVTDILQLGHSNAEKIAIRLNKSSIRVVPKTVEQGNDRGRCEAEYRHSDGTIQRVWIEWKDYDWESAGRPCPAPLVIDRAQKLAALLHHRSKPTPFRVPHCLGYFDNADHDHDHDDDEDRYSNRSFSPIDDENEFRIGFVFEKPESVNPSTPPISLYSLLQKSTKPRVTDRVSLAVAVANCVLYLHSVNWLHKGLRSNNIVFFTSPKTNKIDYSKPYISGFDFARPARPDEQTEIPIDSLEYNLYRHPNTQDTNLGHRETYRKSFDVYSLGVVLVELAHWKPIDRILGIDLTASKNKPKIAQGVRQSLLEEEMVEALGANMGDVYEKAVKRCLIGGTELGIEKGEDETRDGRVAANLSMKFYEEVVRKLEGIRV